MPVTSCLFEDLLGPNQKTYTEDEIVQIMLNSFMLGMDEVKNQTDFDDKDIETMKNWYLDGRVQKVISMIKENLTESEFSQFLQLQQTELAAKMVIIHQKTQQYLLPRLVPLVEAISSNKAEKYREDKDEEMNLDKILDDQWDSADLKL